MRRWLGVRHSCLSYENHVGCWGADRAGAGRALSGAVIRGGDSQTCRASRNCDKRRNGERWREGGGRLRRRSLSRSVLRRFALIRRLVLVAAVDVRFCIGRIGALSARRGIALGRSAIRCAVGHRGFFDNLRGGGITDADRVPSVAAKPAPSSAIDAAVAMNGVDNVGTPCATLADFVGPALPDRAWAWQ